MFRDSVLMPVRSLLVLLAINVIGASWTLDSGAQVRWDAQSNSDLDPVIFNWQFYLDANPDLRNAGFTTEIQAQSHWQSYGKKECRRASSEFSSDDYLRLNPDVANAYGSANCLGAIEHYLQNGRLEGRNKTSPFTYGWQFGGPGSATYGNATFGNEKITIRTTAQYSGTVAEIWFRGKQYVNNHDTGRLFQTALTFDHKGECFNPTEGGSNSDVQTNGGISSGKSLSILNSLSIGNGTLTSVISPAYWYSPGTNPLPYCGIPQGSGPVAPDMMTKSISMNYGGDSQIVHWQVNVDVVADHSQISMEALTGYHMGEFSTFYSYNPATQSLLRTVPSKIEGGSNGQPVFSGNPTHSLPTVMSTADGQHAFGVLALDQEGNTPDGITRVATYFQVSALNPNDSIDSTTKWSVWYNYLNAKKGRYTTNVFLAFGNLNEVTERMRKLYSQNPNQLLRLLASPAGSAAFDFSYYLAKYPDLRNAFGGDYELSLQHYLINGAFEGRNGSAVFNAKNYMGLNSDLQNAFGRENSLAGLKHFIKYGKSEGRNGGALP